MVNFKNDVLTTAACAVRYTMACSGNYALVVTYSRWRLWRFFLKEVAFNPFLPVEDISKSGHVLAKKKKITAV
jgi:hypothetical protein